jgi:hypothetical protein
MADPGTMLGVPTPENTTITAEIIESTVESNAERTILTTTVKTTTTIEHISTDRNRDTQLSIRSRDGQIHVLVDLEKDTVADVLEIISNKIGRNPYSLVNSGIRLDENAILGEVSNIKVDYQLIG